MLFRDATELKTALQGVVNVNGPTVAVLDAVKLRDGLIDRLVYNAVFATQEDEKLYLRWLIRELAAQLGIVPASIQGLYEAMGRGETPDFTVPAVNIRTLTYDMARAYFRAAHARNVGAFIFEIAKSEMGYTFQKPSEYTACVLAAAIKENHRGPVFIQGDHFQANAKNYAKDPRKEIEGLKGLIDEAIQAGFYNIDVDTSTLVDLKFPTVDEQQAPNYTNCAELAAYIREKEPKNVTISIGGEIGEVGGHNSTVEEFRAFMRGFLRDFRQRANGAKGISKMSVQTGTEHGGVPTADGKIAAVKLDFNVLREIGEVARKEYGLCGTVQHGASTLPDELFDHFPKNKAAEIHLATGFQNMIYDHALLAPELKREMYEWLKVNCADERKSGQTDEQFFYKTRKKALGPFKQKLWDLPASVRDAMMQDIERKLGFYMEKLNVRETVTLVARHVQAPMVPTQPPVSGASVKDSMEFILSDSGGE